MNESNLSYFSIRKNSNSISLNLVGFWSYPIFINSVNGKTLWMYLISKTEVDTRAKKTLIFRPFASLITYPNSTEAINYQNFAHSHDPFPKVDWKKPIGIFPQDNISEFTVSNFKLYEKNLIKFSVQSTVEYENSRIILKEFKDLYLQLSNPCLKKFIECLSPGFYKQIYH